VQVGVHPGFEDGNATEFTEFCGVGFVVKGTGNEDIKVCISGISGCLDEIGTEDGAKFGLML
jgi:hypothetical protein